MHPSRNTLAWSDLIMKLIAAPVISSLTWPTGPTGTSFQDNRRPSCQQEVLIPFVMTCIILSMALTMMNSILVLSKFPVLSIFGTILTHASMTIMAVSYTHLRAHET